MKITIISSLTTAAFTLFSGIHLEKAHAAGLGNQPSTTCPITVSSPDRLLGRGKHAGQYVDIKASNGCKWKLHSHSTSVEITSNKEGTGSGRLYFDVKPNLNSKIQESRARDLWFMFSSSRVNPWGTVKLRGGVRHIITQCGFNNRCKVKVNHVSRKTIVFNSNYKKSIVSHIDTDNGGKFPFSVSANWVNIKIHRTDDPTGVRYDAHAEISVNANCDKESRKASIKISTRSILVHQNGRPESWPSDTDCPKPGPGDPGPVTMFNVDLDQDGIEDTINYDDDPDLPVGNPKLSQWKFRLSSENHQIEHVTQFGYDADTPFVAKIFNKTTWNFGVYRDHGADEYAPKWYVQRDYRKSFDGNPSTYYVTQWGLKGDTFVTPYDHDLDGIADISIRRRTRLYVLGSRGVCLEKSVPHGRGCIIYNKKLPVRSTMASSGTSTSKYAIDGKYNTAWNARGLARKSIRLDLGAYQQAHALRMLTNQYPEGYTAHTIKIGNSPSSLRSVRTLYQYSKDKQWLYHTFPAGTAFRYMEVETAISPSWVSWREIEVFSD